MNICEAMGMSISHFESILKMTQRELKEHLVQQLRAHDYEPVCKSGFLMQKALSPCCWLPIWTRFMPIGRISSVAPRMDAS